MASGSGDETVRVWDVATGKIAVTLGGYAKDAFSIAFSPDGRLLASATSDKTVRIWDMRTAATVAILTGHSDAVYSVAFSPDGLILASGSRDKTVKLWDVETITSVGQNIRGEEKREGDLQPAKQGKIKVHFTARVDRIEMIGKREAEVVPIEIVPMWLAEVEILSIEKPMKPFDKNGKINLAIHSPARLFAKPIEEVLGNEYSFTVFGILRNGDPDYYGVEAKEDIAMKRTEVGD
jgi:hypothetical protein